MNFSVIVDTVPPGPPAGVVAVPGFNKVTLTWVAPTKNANGTNLIDLMKGHVASPTRLVDITLLPGMDAEDARSRFEQALRQLAALAAGGREVRSFAMQIKATGDDGMIEGYGSVFGVRDSYSDIVAPGAFKASLAAHKAAILDLLEAERMAARRIVQCRDCAHYIPSPPLHRASGDWEMPGGCTQGRTSPDARPPIYPCTGWYCDGWTSKTTH